MILIKYILKSIIIIILIFQKKDKLIFHIHLIINKKYYILFNYILKNNFMHLNIYIFI